MNLINIKPDGNCLFNAVIKGLVLEEIPIAETLKDHFQLRKLVVNYMKKNLKDYSQLIIQQIDISINEFCYLKNDFAFRGYSVKFTAVVVNWISAQGEPTPQNTKMFKLENQDDQGFKEQLIILYIENLLNDNIWGGGIELQTVCDMFKIEVVLYDKETQEILGSIGEDNKDGKINLTYNGTHYDVAIHEFLFF